MAFTRPRSPALSVHSLPSQRRSPRGGVGEARTRRCWGRISVDCHYGMVSKRTKNSFEPFEI